MLLHTDSGIAAIVSTIATLAGVIIAHQLQGRANLIAFSPNSTFFQLKRQDGAPVPVRSGQVMIQNLGRNAARSVQITTESNGAPAGYSIVPTIVHDANVTNNNEWIVDIPFIAPKETITLQILNGPNVEAIRSAEGVARFVPVAHQRTFPKWFNVVVIALFLWGLASLLFVIARWLIQI